MSPGRAPGLPPGALMGPDSTPALAHLQLYAMHNAGECAATMRAINQGFVGRLILKYSDSLQYQLQ